MKATKTSNYTDHKIVWSFQGEASQNPSEAALSTTSAKEGAMDNDKSGDLPMFFPPTEFLVDKARLDQEDVLSVFARMYHPQSGSGGVARGRVEVAVLDFSIDE